MSENLKPQIHAPEQIADYLGVDREQVYLWMADEKIPYVENGEGDYRIPLGGVQTVLPQLINIEGDLAAIHDAAAQVDPSIDVLTEFHRER